MQCVDLVIYHIKQESGSFRLPVFDQSTNTFQTNWQDLMMMVRGVSADGKVNKKNGEPFKTPAISGFSSKQLIFRIFTPLKTSKDAPWRRAFFTTDFGGA